LPAGNPAWNNTAVGRRSADQEQKTGCNSGIYAGFESGSWRAEPAKNPAAKKTKKKIAKKIQTQEGRTDFRPK
jgi:hypothetical protein